MAKLVEEKLTINFSKLFPNGSDVESIVTKEDKDAIRVILSEIFDEDSSRIVELDDDPVG